MKLKNGWYCADEGKHFVLTEKGKFECASYRSKTVGEPVRSYDYEAVAWSVDKGYVIEVPIPDWIECTGYEVVYDHKGYTLFAGNPIVFPFLEMAERYMQNYGRYSWVEDDLYIRESVYKGIKPKDCREYNGKKIYNMSCYFGVDALMPGDLVEEEIVNDLMDCVSPACMRSDCSQVGEPANHEVDEKDGICKATYATFKRIAEGIWQYCGKCFRGENVQRGIVAL